MTRGFWARIAIAAFTIGALGGAAMYALLRGW